MIISDMDDTVIHTGLTNLRVAAQLTFLNNARTRKPLTGVGGLYRSLVHGSSGERVNPIFYVSNSAWNMWDLLRDFLDLNDLPAGPLLLRDIGPEGDTSDHKIESIRSLMERLRPLPAILVGDSGQHDAEVYARIATEFPDRVQAIYIRDVDPDDPSDYDAGVDRIIEKSRQVGVPFLRVAHSADIAEHAATIGLLPGSEIDDVEADLRRDEGRETLAEAADVIDVR
jgi:phosphatidate phosphatase APP1